MKGPDGGEEAKAAQHALLCLQGKLRRQVDFTLPDDSRRTLLVVEKTGHTPATYPRAGAKWQKSAVKNEGLSLFLHKTHVPCAMLMAEMAGEVRFLIRRNENGRCK